MNDADSEKAASGDLWGAGQIINSEVAKRTYEDGLSPAVKQVGALTTDALKSFRLFMAPLQLMAAYQDRFEKFCGRVRERVPESEQCDAAPEIARPVMEAFASTSDGSAMMLMFEELMAKAIDKREAKKLSPQFPEIVKSLSPLEALLVVRLRAGEQFTDDLRDPRRNIITRRVSANFSFDDFGGQDHHLTLIQRLEHMKIAIVRSNQPVPEGTYPDLNVPPGMELARMVIRLSMFGQWFANAVTPLGSAKKS
jgi:hypothetical protein